MLGRLLKDFWGLRRVCGLRVALRWLWRGVLNAGQCIRNRNLSAADRAMGWGPFRVRYGNINTRLAGYLVIAGIREIWVRNVYLGQYLRLPDTGVVVDLGANRGYFSVVAAANPGVRVVSVEPSRIGCASIRDQSIHNGCQDRLEICNHFIGGDTARQHDAQRIPDSDEVSYISEEEFITRHSLSHIDLLKCDIEGSEYELLKPGSRLLAMTSQLAIEVHGAPEKREPFRQMLLKEGFEVVCRSENATDCILNAWRPASKP